MVQDLKTFKKRFFEVGLPFWKAFKGSLLVGKYTDLPEGWSKLTTEEKAALKPDLLQKGWRSFEQFQISYGKATNLKIELKNNPNSGKDSAQYSFVEWGDNETTSNQNNFGMNMKEAMEVVAMFQNPLQQQLNLLQQQLQNEKERNWEFQLKKIEEDRKREREELLSIIEHNQKPSMKEELLKEGIGIGKVLANGFAHQMGYGQYTQPLQHGIAGVKGQAADTTQEQTEETVTPEEQAQISRKRLMNACSGLQQILVPHNIHFIEFLELLLNKGTENPALVGMLISQLR